MKKETEKFFDSDILEGMPSISALIHAQEAEDLHNDRKIIEILIDNTKMKSKERPIAFLKAKSQELGFSIRYVPSQDIENIAVGTSHGGIVACCTPRTIPSLDADLILDHGCYFCLDGVEDPYNFGYAVRSLYASGVDGLIIPPRNWMGAAGVVARSSAGASELINLFVADTEDAIKQLKQKNYHVVCAGIRDSVSLFETELKKPLLVILGGEKRGISQKVLALADEIIRIDYGASFRGSLSTSAAAAVFGFEILRQTAKR